MPSGIDVGRTHRFSSYERGIFLWRAKLTTGCNISVGYRNEFRAMTASKLQRLGFALIFDAVARWAPSYDVANIALYPTIFTPVM